MKNIILITVFIGLVCSQDLVDAFTELSSSDPERCKLNWPTLSGAIKDLLADV